MKRYEVKGWLKQAEEDIFSEGCDPDTSFAVDNTDMTWSAETVDDLINQLREFTGAREEDDAVLRDSCDEKGRIDIQLMETEQSYPASEGSMRRWREGKTRLWAVTYTFKMELVERTTVSAL